MRYKLLREFNVARKFAASGGLTYEEAGEFAGYDLEEDPLAPWLAVKDLWDAQLLEDSGDLRRLSTGVMHPVFRITSSGIMALDRAAFAERGMA